MAGSNVPSNVIIRINDKDVINSFNGINKEVKKLENELKGMTRGTEAWIKKFEELEEAKKHLEAVKKEMKETNKSLSDVLNNSVFSGNVAANFFENALGKVKELGVALKERVEELLEIKRTLSLLDKDLRGSSLDKAAASVKSISETYQKGVEEIQVAVKALNAQTHDTNKSLDLIKKGFEVGADASGEMLAQIKEYPTMMKDAKVSAEQMIAIMAEAEKLGTYDDKGIDAIKEGMLKIREGTKATKDAMTALGIDVNDIYKKISSGAMSYFEALQLVSKKIKETGADSRVTGTAIADIFGGPGEDAGYEYISQLQTINTNLDSLTDSTNETVIAKKKELEANEKLNNVWVQLTGTASTLNKAYSALKSSLADALSYMFKIKEAKVSDEYLNQQNRLIFLKSQLDRTNISEAKKLEIFQELKKEFPQYFSGLDLEKMKHDEITKAINRSIDAMGRKYKAQTFQELFNESSDDFNEKFKKTLQLEKDGQNLMIELQQKYAKSGIFDFNFKSNTTVNQLRELLAQYRKINVNIRDNETESKLSTLVYSLSKANRESTKADLERIKNQKIYLDLQGKLLPDVFKTNENKGPSKDRDFDAEAAAKKAAEKAKKEAEVAAKKAESDLEKSKSDFAKALQSSEKNNQELLSAKQKFTEESFKIVQTGKQKEWDLETQDYENKKAAIAQENEARKTANIALQAEIDKLSNDVKNTKDPKAKALFLKTQQEKKDQQDHNLKMINENNKLEDQIFQTHGWNLLRIEEKFQTERYIKKAEALQAAADLERKSSEDMINNISTMDEAKHALSQMSYLKLTDQELASIETLEDAKKALRENADRAYIASQLKLIDEQKKILRELMQDPSISPEALEQLKKQLDELNVKTTQLKSTLTGNQEADNKKVNEDKKSQKEKIDILGFTASDWEKCWKNLETTSGKIEAVKMVVGALSNAFKAFSDLQNVLAEKEMTKYQKNQDKKKTLLQTQLDEGWITQEEYNKNVQKIEAETARKKAEISYKQAKTERAIKIAEIIVATSLGIMQAYSQLGPIGGTIAAVLIGTLGAFQLATVANTPLPEVPSYAEGGYFEGYTGNSNLPPDETGERPVGLVKLHQKEWVAPRWMRENPKTAKVIDYLESVRTGKSKPMAEGGFVNNETQQTTSSTQQTFENSSEMSKALQSFSKMMLEIREKGFVAYFVNNLENAKGVSEMLNNYNETLNRNKHK